VGWYISVGLPRFIVLRRVGKRVMFSGMGQVGIHLFLNEFNGLRRRGNADTQVRQVKNHNPAHYDPTRVVQLGSRSSARPAAKLFPFNCVGYAMEALRRPEWWSEDVFFDPTGKEQRGWARAGAAAYRAAHPERYGEGASVTKSVTSGEKSVTVSVTSSVTPPDESVTKKEKTAARVKRWRAAKRGGSHE